MSAIYNHNGRKINFVYDIADSPFYYSEKYLKESDLYFKAQCPKEIKDSGFQLNENIAIPYTKSTLIYKSKIRPSLLGVRKLGESFKYKELKTNYLSLLYVDKNKENRLFVYFGSEKYPQKSFKEETSIELARTEFFNVEENLSYFDNNTLHHPNSKRGIVSRKLKLTSNDRLHLGDVFENEIDINNYQEVLSKYKYNLNISGYRLSIPNRFMDSFISGTTVLTDNLSVRWYQDFSSEECRELGKLGYDVSSDKALSDFVVNIEKECEITQKRDVVLEKFHKYWKPKSFANYILDELENHVKV
ncbi:hypothetical protein [Vibrio breoganii]|uniref:hypothetical protein n=1 Tax=Vibrio breoganii TaxID=553239 RepID=UPI0010BD2042|nr:hypothetical protein [Vibrio breoganii]TKG21073.1 hypothetical protein FCV81_10070 [Vibrio breoganii]